MRLTRLYIAQKELANGVIIPLEDNHAHYLLRVLRMEAGTPVVLFNETSGAWQGNLGVQGKKGFVTLEKNIQQPMPCSNVHLLQSPLKKEAWDFMIEKATELNVASIKPVTMDFTQNARLNEDRTRLNLIEAAQQCERTTIPKLEPVEKLDTVLRNWDKDHKLYVALERSDARAALAVFNTHDTMHPAYILVGPEGGFSPRERELMSKYDFVQPITLGSLILRAETAAIAALAIFSAVK